MMSKWSRYPALIDDFGNKCFLNLTGPKIVKFPNTFPLNRVNVMMVTGFYPLLELIWMLNPFSVHGEVSDILCSTSVFLKNVIPLDEVMRRLFSVRTGVWPSFVHERDNGRLRFLLVDLLQQEKKPTFWKMQFYLTNWCNRDSDCLVET